MNDRNESPLVEPLSERERMILRLLADGLTNREIADRLHLSHETIKWYNKQIYGKLGVSNRTQAAAKAEEHAKEEYLKSSQEGLIARPRHNLPISLTSFIGRQRQLDEVSDYLKRSRLLTLTGPPGTGKTRLAIEIASHLLEEFADGVHLVELAPLKDSALVADTFAESLGVSEIEGQPQVQNLKDYLRNKEMLILADNFEHVINSAPLAAELLADCPGLKFLATSREALGLYGEQEYLVLPLALPDPDRPEPPEALLEYEAVSLFVQRAQAVRPEFSLTNENATAVSEICMRLDGLPLAIELAAARIRIFNPQLLLEKLESLFTSLRGDLRDQPVRHVTLLAAIAWSYDLLDDAEKVLFAWLSVFRGGFSIDAVGEICDDSLSIDILPGLESLLRKNLLRQIEGPGGELRFQMLETIHEFARDQLDRTGTASELRSRHAEYFAGFVEQARSASRGGPNQLLQLDQLEAEHDNIRGALEWSLGSDNPIQALRIVGGLSHFWFRKGHYAEARRWTSAALHSDRRFTAPPPVQAALLHSAGVVAHFSDEPDEGRQLHLEALDLYRELDDEIETGWLLVYLGAQAFGQPDQSKQALAHVQEGLALLERANDRAGMAQALNVIGEISRHGGEQQKAIEAFTEGLSIARELGHVLREILILDSLTYIAIYDDDVEKAAALSREAFTLTMEVDHLPHIPAAIAAEAAISMAEGHPDRAARLIGASHSLFAAHGFTPRPSDMPDIDRTISLAQGALGLTAFEAAWAIGQEMAMEEAIDYALSGTSNLEIPRG